MKDLYVPLSVAPEKPERALLAVAEAPLHVIEQCALAIIHADPRMAKKCWRVQLRTMLREVDASFNADRVGQAVARLRLLAQAGSIATDAFTDQYWGAPERERCEAAFEAVASVRGWGGPNAARMARRKAYFLQHFGFTDPLLRQSPDSH